MGAVFCVEGIESEARGVETAILLRADGLMVGKVHLHAWYWTEQWMHALHGRAGLAGAMLVIKFTVMGETRETSASSRSSNFNQNHLHSI